MRSHAKASSAGSNSGKGASLGSLRRFASLFVLVALLAGLLPGSALALQTRPPVESFGPDGTAATTFGFPSALAFDQGNKRLYALDQSAESIDGFDVPSAAAHTPLGGNFPVVVSGSSTEFLDLAVDSGSHQIYHSALESGQLNGFDASGTPLGGNFPLGAVCGVGVDPAGNIWVGQGGAVEKYDSAGNPIGSVDVSANGFPCDFDFDSQANLYVSYLFGAIWKYSAASGYTSATEVDPSSSGSLLYSAIAVDRSSDELYVTHGSHISVYDSSGAPLYEFGSSVSGADFTGIAIDQGTDRVFASDAGNGKVEVFGSPVPLPEVLTEDADEITDTAATLHGTLNPEGEQLTDCRFEYGTSSAYGESAPCVPAAGSIPADSDVHAVSAEVSGLSPNTTYHFRLAAQTAEGTAEGLDRVLTTAAGPPTIDSQSVEAVGNADVTLSAKVNPQGAKTTYLVEYGTTSAYGQSVAGGLPIGSAGDTSTHTVSVHIGGLTPGVAYHFRFVATSPAGSAQGTDATFATYPAQSAFGPCANDQYRGGFGGRLPDCRAYEQVTPNDKHGANIQGTLNAIQASRAGDRIDFFSVGGLPTSGGGAGQSPFLASRGAAGWSFDGLLPATTTSQFASVFGWNEDLSKAVVAAPGPGETGEAIYLRDSDSGALELGPERYEAVFVPGFAADDSHLIFENQRSLLPGVPTAGYKLYELDHGVLTLAGRIPAGAARSCDDASGPACVPAPEGSFAGPYSFLNSDTKSGGPSRQFYTQNTISRDGSRVFFTAAGSGQLYAREDGTRTTRISASQRTTPDPNGEKPAIFMAATPGGSKVFFLSCEKLTDDSTAVSSAGSDCLGRDLYSYDVETGELTDLTVDPNVGDPNGADVHGLLGASDDGSHIYFVAGGVLAPGASASACCNLYVVHGGATKFIAQLAASDQEDWIPNSENLLSKQQTSRVSADGSAVLFSSRRSLTGYNNFSSNENACPFGRISGGSFCLEFYRYAPLGDELTCVSCNPTGVPPRGDATWGTIRVFNHNDVRSPFLTRNLSTDGSRAFFETRDALLPSDTNGINDVYEWEAKGSGSCKTESQNGGCIYLVSSGTSPDPSYFADASSNGDHAFLFTSQQLVPTDHDELVDIYDAGVGAGLAAQHVLAPPTCTSTACQVNSAPPPDQPAASAVFSGPGNAHKPPAARRCPKGKRKVRRAGKVRCQKAHKQHKRHSNRGGSK